MKHFLFLTFCLLGTLLFAHDIHYSYENQRQWTLEKAGKTLEGSFYLYKDGEVYIEDEHQQIQHFPLNTFSEQDQQFVVKKYEAIQTINQAVATKSTTNPQANYGFVLLAILIMGLGVYFYSIANSKKMRIFAPAFSLTLVLVLLGFNQKAQHTLQTNTNPSTIDSAFAAFKPNINTFWDATYFYVESKGIPTTHTMMVGISNHGWQQQVPIPQCYIGNNAWPIPLNPTIAASPIPVDSIHFTRGAIAIAANGIPIFNVHTNTGADSYLTGQLDNFGGHCGRGDDYHYHIAPLHLYNYTTATLPIAYGLDGFAVYGSVEPDGSAMTSLDSNHGHFGTNGVYHYHGTATAPYMIANMAGQVTEDATHQLIPQAAAHPVRNENWTPLNGALITACTPNGTNNGYTVSYTLNGTAGYATDYSWSPTGVYTFNYVTPSGTTTKTYNGFTQCTVPTSINEVITKESTVSIYPNPTSETVHIQLQNGATEKDVRAMEIYTIKGELIYRENTFKENIDVQKFSKGIYILKITMKKGEFTKKLMLQ